MLLIGFVIFRWMVIVGADKTRLRLQSAKKVKNGTSLGIKWVKDQYQKRTSKGELQVVDLF